MILLLTVTPVLAQAPKSFSSTKKLLSRIHREIGHEKTVYCGCGYKRNGHGGGKVDMASCGLEARKNATRAGRIEWEHVVPASWFGSMRTCWALGAPKCGEKKGRACCTKSGVNPAFMQAHNDPNNLFPSAGEVNGDRSNKPYGEVDHERRVYGGCDIEISTKLADPAPEVRGELARAMLYMVDTYGADVKLPLRTLLDWHEDDPAEEWEVDRAEAIKFHTGLANRWILP
jgi:deoxyribonuclease-1